MSHNTATSAADEPPAADGSDWIGQELARMDGASALGQAEQAVELRAAASRVNGAKGGRPRKADNRSA